MNHAPPLTLLTLNSLRHTVVRYRHRRRGKRRFSASNPLMHSVAMQARV